MDGHRPYFCTKNHKVAIKSNDLERDGEIEKGQRITRDNEVLQWHLTSPSPTPEVELLPFFIEWDTTKTHPTSFLNEGCSLDSFYATHPNPQ